MGEPLPLPPEIRSHLVDLIRMRFHQRDPQPTLDALPDALEPGVVHRLASGGAFGWMLEARLDDVRGRVALECLEDSRMAGPDHYRMWEDGTREELPTEHTAFSQASDATEAEIDAARQAMYEHNQAVQAGLRERGFRT